MVAMNLGVVALPVIELGRFCKRPVRAILHRLRTNLGGTTGTALGNHLASITTASTNVPGAALVHPPAIHSALHRNPHPKPPHASPPDGECEWPTTPLRASATPPRASAVAQVLAQEVAVEPPGIQPAACAAAQEDPHSPVGLGCSEHRDVLTS
jgi:hypothetical protein